MNADQNFQSVKPFQLAQSHMTLGKFPILDVICQRWGQLIENSIYERTGLVCEVLPNSVVQQRFEKYLKEHSQPELTYLLELGESLQALFSMDKQFLKVCTLQEIHIKNPKLLQIVGAILLDFKKSWQGLNSFKIVVKKAITHPLRAKIMLPFEHCLRFMMTVKFEDFKSSIEFCMPYAALDSILKWDSYNVLPSASIHQGQIQQREKLEKALRESYYQVNVELGAVTLPRKNKMPYLKVGEVLPVNSNIGDQVIVKIAGQPSFSGSLGITENHYSIRLNANYFVREEEYRTRIKKFTPAIWQQVTTS